MKAVLMGPPQTGKSCLRAGLKEAVRRIPGAPYPYVITACPDGEGAWFQETASQDAVLARRLKDAYKASFSEAFVARLAAEVSTCQLPLTLVDIGGKITPENRRICAGATHAVLLVRDDQQKAEWTAFCAELGLVVVAEVYSAYHATEDVVTEEGGDVLRGSVHHLERGEANHEKPCVVALARHLVRLAT